MDELIVITEPKRAYWIEGQISLPPTFKYGRLIEKKHLTFKCSLCRSGFVGIIEGFRYCPNCGAKMDGDRNG